MAKYSNGINGSFSGSVGKVVGCTWKGIHYMRSAPAKRSSGPSLAEKANREKFTLSQLWLKPLTPLLRIGFKNYSPTVEGFVAAKSYLLKNAIIQTETGCAVDPEKVLISFGGLENPEATAEINDNKLVVSWQDNKIKHERLKDQALVLAYCLDLKEAVYETHGAFRNSGREELILPEHFRNKRILVYLAFVSSDRESQSMSQFLGELLM